MSTGSLNGSSYERVGKVKCKIALWRQHVLPLSAVGWLQQLALTLWRELTLQLMSWQHVKFPGGRQKPSLDRCLVFTVLHEACPAITAASDFDRQSAWLPINFDASLACTLFAFHYVVFSSCYPRHRFVTISHPHRTSRPLNKLEPTVRQWDWHISTHADPTSTRRAISRTAHP